MIVFEPLFFSLSPFPFLFINTEFWHKCTGELQINCQRAILYMSIDILICGGSLFNISIFKFLSFHSLS